MPVPEVVVEDGYTKEDGPFFGGYGVDEQEYGVDVDATQGDMELHSQLTQDQHCTNPIEEHEVGCINDNFDVGSYERDEEEQQEDETIGAKGISDSDSSDDDVGGMDVPVPQLTVTKYWFKRQ